MQNHEDKCLKNRRANQLSFSINDTHNQVDDISKKKIHQKISRLTSINYGGGGGKLGAKQNIISGMKLNESPFKRQQFSHKIKIRETPSNRAKTSKTQIQEVRESREIKH